MSILGEYKNIEDKNETLISIFIYDKKISQFIKFLEDQLEKSKKISNPIKKNKINNRLFNLLKYIKDNYDDEIIINSIFLLYDKTIEYKLNKDEINTAKNYNFLNIFIKNDILFYIDYFNDLLYNFEFIYTLKINKNDVSVIKLNKNKEKELKNYKNCDEQKIIEIIDDIRKINKDLIIIYGNFSLILKIDNKNIIIEKNFLNKEHLFSLYETEIMKKNHFLLKNRLDDIQNENTNLDLYVFGKLKNEIKDSIETYSIKELYIEEKKIEKLKNLIDADFFNFKIIPLKILEPNDIADNFIKNYNGIMAIKYY